MINKIKNVRVLGLVIVTILLLVSLSGCSKEVNKAVDKAADKAASKIESAYNDIINEDKEEEKEDKEENKEKAQKNNKDAKLPKYNGKAYQVINNNKPTFKASELKTKSYEHYGKLDSLGRCSVAIACIGKDLMPKSKRGSIGRVKPTGWKTAKYDVVDGKYLYNRCHLIGYQLTGENANERNLITGTRYLNVDGMLPFEDMVADYVKETGNHVLYKVTPVYKGKNLVASGVKMEAKSVEDKGKGICFNIYVYNIQPGVTIDYATGESKLSK